MPALLGVTLAALSACGGGSPSPATVDGPGAAGPASAGLVELEIAGMGSAAVTSHLNWLDEAGAAPKRALAVRPTAVGNLPQGLDVRLQSAGTVDVGTRGAGGMRYITATYDIRNAQFCSTTGTCPAYTTARRNLTFMAVITSSTINQSAITRFVRFDSSPANPALATQLMPTHGMTTTTTAVRPDAASLQVYRESELPATDPGALSVLPYGFVVRHRSNGTRTLAANPGSQVFDGRVTFAFKIPLQANAADDPFKLSMRFQVVEDSVTRVTQSPEESSFAGDVAATSRAAALGATDLAVLCDRLAQLLNGNPICGVRVAGLAGNATARLVPSGGALVTVSAPANLENVPVNSSVVLGTSQAMAAPAETTLFVHGSQSGQRTLTGFYGGVLDGGGSSGLSNQLVWRLRPTDRPFFPGETVSFTATGGNRNLAGVTALPAFVGSFRTAGSSASSLGLFESSAVRAVGTGPFGVALADLNRDGLLDSVTANLVDSTITVLSSPAYGATTLNVGGGPRSVVAGDMNGDGQPDIVTANYLGSSVSVLLSNGTGAYANAVNYPIGADVNPQFVALGDFNGDGRLDVVVANDFGGNVTVFLNTGTGTLGSPTSYTVGPRPTAVAVGDIDGDGRLDLVVSNFNSNDVSVLMGVIGGFAQRVNYAVAAGPRSVALGDINGDGRPDIVVPAQTGNSLSVLLNNGAGGFQAASSFAAGTRPYSLVLGDVDGDGVLDAVVSHLTRDAAGNNVSVFLGNGAGGFALRSGNPTSGENPTALALGDVNGDGKLDFVVAAQAQGGNTLSTWVGK